MTDAGKKKSGGGQLIEGDAAREGSYFRMSAIDPRVVIAGEDDDNVDHVLHHIERGVGTNASEIDEAMIASMMRRRTSGKKDSSGAYEMTGNKEPITVRVEGEDGNLFVVVKGRRRLRHMREVHRRCVAADLVPPELRVRAVKLSDADAVVDMVEENAHRVDNTPLENALECARLKPLMNWSNAECMAHYGVSDETLRQWFIVASMSTRMHAAIRADGLSVASALALWKKPPAERDAALDAIEAKTADGESKPRLSKSQVAGKRGKRFFVNFAAKHEEVLPEEFRLGALWALGRLADDKLPAEVRELLLKPDDELVELVFEHGLTRLHTPTDKIAERVKRATGKDVDTTVATLACRELKRLNRATHNSLGYARASA